MNKISVLVYFLYWISYAFWWKESLTENVEITTIDTIKGIAFMCFLFLMPSIDLVDSLTE